MRLLTIAGLVALSSSVAAFAQSKPAGDVARGQSVYEAKCAMCHGSGRKTTAIAPTLAGIAGRKSASISGFPYSSALKRANLTWDVDTVQRFLTAPSKLVPGTKMPIALPNSKDRADVIAYLWSSPATVPAAKNR